MSPENNERVDIDSLEQWSESIVDHLEKIEHNLGIIDVNERVSDDLRLAYLKINSLSRSDDDNSKLQLEYSNILDNYKRLTVTTYNSKSEYLDATSMLINELGNLTINDWEKLVDSEIDWGIFEAWSALVSWIQKAWEKIYDEFMETFEKLWMLWDLWSVMQAIFDSLSIDTFKNIYDELVDLWWDTIRDFTLILNNSTTSWKIVEMSNFIPYVWIPILFDKIWPWKFLKLLDIAIPPKILLALEKWEKYVPDVFKKNNNVPDKLKVASWNNILEDVWNTLKWKFDNVRWNTVEDSLLTSYNEETLGDNKKIKTV